MRVRDEAKLLALKEAAFDLVEESGIVNLSINKLAKKAGVSVATTYIYFDSKTDLLGKLFLEVYHILVEDIVLDDETTSVEEKFTTLLKQYVANFVQHPREVAFYAAMTANPEYLPEALRGKGSLLGSAMLTIIKEAYKEGRLVTANVDLIIAQALQPIQWLLVERLRHEMTISEDETTMLNDMAKRALFK